MIEWGDTLMFVEEERDKYLGALLKIRKLLHYSNDYTLPRAANAVLDVLDGVVPDDCIERFHEREVPDKWKWPYLEKIKENP